jgi:hypothetical protein
MSTQAAAHAPQRAVLRVGLIQRGSEAGLRRDVGEGSIAVVVVQRAVMHAADEDVFVTVVIVIANRDARVVTRAGQTRRFGHVREMAVAIVAEQAIEILRRGLLQAANVGAVGEEDIQLAVVVVIEDRDAARHGLRRVPLRRFATVERERNRPIRETDRAWSCFRWWRQASRRWRRGSPQSGPAFAKGRFRIRWREPAFIAAPRW